MTIAEALARIDDLKPNSFLMESKIAWLSALDGKVKKEIIDTHDDGDDITFTPYTADTDQSTTLLIPAPYDEVYIYYLSMQIDYNSGELDKANNSVAMYSAALNDFVRYYNRNHMPKYVLNKYY